MKIKSLLAYFKFIGVLTTYGPSVVKINIYFLKL